MNYTVGGLWLTYAIVVVVLFAIFYFLFAGNRYKSTSSVASRAGMAALLALLIGAVIAFVGSLWINNGNLDSLSHGDRVALNWLYAVAIILPILALIFVIYGYRQNSCAPACPEVDACDPCAAPEEQLIKEKYVCDNNGVCALRAKTVKKGVLQTTVKYT